MEVVKGVRRHLRLRQFRHLHRRLHRPQHQWLHRYHWPPRRCRWLGLPQHRCMHLLSRHHQ